MSERHNPSPPIPLSEELERMKSLLFEKWAATHLGFLSFLVNILVDGHLHGELYKYALSPEFTRKRIEHLELWAATTPETTPSRPLGSDGLVTQLLPSTTYGTSSSSQLHHNSTLVTSGPATPGYPSLSVAFGPQAALIPPESERKIRTWAHASHGGGYDNDIPMHSILASSQKNIDCEDAHYNIGVPHAGSSTESDLHYNNPEDSLLQGYTVPSASSWGLLRQDMPLGPPADTLEHSQVQATIANNTSMSTNKRPTSARGLPPAYEDPVSIWRPRERPSEAKGKERQSQPSQAQKPSILPVSPPQSQPLPQLPLTSTDVARITSTTTAPTLNASSGTSSAPMYTFLGVTTPMPPQQVQESYSGFFRVRTNDSPGISISTPTLGSGPKPSLSLGKRARTPNEPQKPADEPSTNRARQGEAENSKTVK